MIRKVYHTVDKKLYPFNLRKVGREKKIYFCGSDSLPFIRWENKRVYIDSCFNLSYPLMYEDENGRYGVISGLVSRYGIRNSLGEAYVEILDGEYVQLWEEV